MLRKLFFSPQDQNLPLRQFVLNCVICCFTSFPTSHVVFHSHRLMFPPLDISFRFIPRGTASHCKPSETLRKHRTASCFSFFNSENWKLLQLWKTETLSNLKTEKFFHSENWKQSDRVNLPRLWENTEPLLAFLSSIRKTENCFNSENWKHLKRQSKPWLWENTDVFCLNCFNSENFLNSRTGRRYENIGKRKLLDKTLNSEMQKIRTSFTIVNTIVILMQWIGWCGEADSEVFIPISSGENGWPVRKTECDRAPLAKKRQNRVKTTKIRWSVGGGWWRCKYHSPVQMGESLWLCKDGSL